RFVTHSDESAVRNEGRGRISRRAEPSSLPPLRPAGVHRALRHARGDLLPPDDVNFLAHGEG
ncbi:hypothetical protein, partial [Streptomyces sp. NPDC048411]|uniref:hypothetical protein n=1 Tax=Streptomyces sp. NPDC048411 TaxID=3157206 RepID=UPI003453D65F